jgi:hypothetical protein
MKEIKLVPKYKLVYQDDGNVTFLDYGKKYKSYAYRMVWTRKNHFSQTSDWYLNIFQQHINGLDLMPQEIKLAKKAYKDLTK